MVLERARAPARVPGNVGQPGVGPPDAGPDRGHGPVSDRPVAGASVPQALVLPLPGPGDSKGERSPRRRDPLPGPDDRPVGHGRNREHRRGGHRHRLRRTRGAVLDVGDGTGGHGHQVRRGSAGGPVPHPGSARRDVGRTHALPEPGLQSAGAGRPLCLSGSLHPHRGRQHDAGPLHRRRHAGRTGSAHPLDRRRYGRRHRGGHPGRHPQHRPGSQRPGAHHDRHLLRGRPAGPGASLAGDSRRAGRGLPGSLHARPRPWGDSPAPPS